MGFSFKHASSKLKRQTQFRIMHSLVGINLPRAGFKPPAVSGDSVWTLPPKPPWLVNVCKRLVRKEINSSCNFFLVSLNWVVPKFFIFPFPKEQLWKAMNVMVYWYSLLRTKDPNSIPSWGRTFFQMKDFFITFKINSVIVMHITKYP